MDLYDDLEGSDGTCNDVNLALKHNDVKRVDKDESLALARSEVSQYRQQNAQLLRKCTMLEKNLSCLYKTAWAHVRRKDEYIESLKDQIKQFRKATGMVAPGVPLDGVDAADDVEELTTGNKLQRQAPDAAAEPSTHQRPPKRSRAVYSQDRKAAAVDMPHAQSKDAGAREAHTVAPPGCSRASNDRGHRAGAAQDQHHRPSADQGRLRLRSDLAIGSHGTPAHRERPSSNSQHHAPAGHTGRHSRSMSPPPAHRRHESRSAPALSMKDSHRPLQSLPTGRDLRRRNMQSQRFHVSPTRRPRV
eukprot:jgi/Ulvmu1/12200/UM085_0064.1